MRKTIQTLMMLVMLAVAQTVASQAVLPTFWNFDDVQPTGWTESLAINNGLTRYTAGGYFVSAPSACKLDGTGEFVEIEFAEEPGTVTYNIRSSNAPFAGTFTVEESANGTTWSTLHTFSDGELSAAHVEYNDIPQSSTRYIRFFFTNKVSGFNVALDDVGIAAAQAGAAQEINVTDGTDNIPSGFGLSMGGNTQQTFTVQNLGSASGLSLIAVEITGENASEFSIDFTPTTVPANGEQAYTISFTPTFNGSHFCSITINSDDTSESFYVVNVTAVSGGLASEPDSQATSLGFDNVSSWDFQTTINASTSAADGYLVLRKKGSPVTESPVDGTTYVRGQWIGSTQVVYVGADDVFDARGIEAGSTYHLSAFAFNGEDGFENYLSDSPTTSTINTPAPNFGNLYSGINLTAPTLAEDLTSLMNPTNYYQIYYSNYISTLINNFYVRDTVENGVYRNMVECQYSGVPFIFDNSFFWTSLSREHNFPQSWMPSYLDAAFDESFEVSDLHNLTPVWQNLVNAVRSNYPYGEVITPSSTYFDCQLGDNEFGQNVYEMRDSFKGDAARAVMYHATKNNTASDDFSLPEQISLTIQYGQNEHLLKQWHFQDLPDSWEITRNEYIQSEQRNRNAFIDQVTYPCHIRFADLTPFTPEFIFNSTTLTCIDPAQSYQWYLDGNPIAEATSATYDWTTAGDYSVEIQQFDQCPAFTSSTSLVGTSVDEANSTQFDLSVFPNPSEGHVVVKTHASRPTAAQLNVLDMTGKVVFTSNENLNGGLNLIAIDEEISAGVYTVEIRSGASAQTTRLVIR